MGRPGEHVVDRDRGADGRRDSDEDSAAAARRRRAGLVAFGADIVTRTPAGAMVLGCLPVVPMTIVSALLMVIVSRLTAAARVRQDTLARYFPGGAL